jgi:peptide/nickel transport system substrate-binding protein
MASNYWSKVLDRRISRRRAIAATGASAAAAAFLAACGGGGGGDGVQESSGLLSLPVDSSDRVKRDGIFKDRLLSDPPSLDILTANLPNNHMNNAYSSLLRTKPGYMKPSEGEAEGYLAESFEQSADGLTFTMKLRQGVKWHNKPPLNGRLFDAEDVVFAYNRFAEKGAGRSGVVNSANPSAPVLSLTATDARTIVVKLSEPVIWAPSFFTSASSGAIVMVPKETDTTFDIRTDMIGTGPFVMTNYNPSVSITFQRNEEFFDKDWPLVKQLDLPIIGEYASALAQFKAGNIYTFGPNVINSEDILPVKREEPRIGVYQTDLGSPPGTSAARVLSFGWLPEGKSPFLDERVRQAMSRSWDRQLFLDTFSNKLQYEAEGLAIASRWNTALDAGYEGWWLDPQSNDLGPDAKNFHYDVGEAKKLLSAAGYPNGFDTTSHYVTTNELATAKLAEILNQMAAEAGIRNELHSVDYLKEYIPGYRDAKGAYDGWAFKSDNGGPPTGGEAIGALSLHHWSASAIWHGLPDTQVDQMIQKGRLELDVEKRKQIVFDLQKYLAKKMYILRPPGLTTGFTMAWPCIGNYRVWNGGGKYYRQWIDVTKPPFTSA